LRSFARKNLQTVENDREKFSGPLSLRGKYYAADCIGLIANDCAGSERRPIFYRPSVSTARAITRRRQCFVPEL
jgi:hypothetical protein